MDAATMTEMNQDPESKSAPNLKGMVGLATRVRCEGFICLAYRDTDGKWRNYYTKELLPPVLEILSPESK